MVNDLTGSQPCAGKPLTCPALYIVLAFGFLCVVFVLFCFLNLQQFKKKQVVGICFE